MRRLLAVCAATACAHATLGVRGSAAVEWTPCSARLDALVPVSSGVYGAVVSSLKGDTGAVRLYVNTERGAYAVVLDGLRGMQTLRYVTIPADEHVSSSWVDRAGKTAATMAGCSVPTPSPDDDTTIMERREVGATALARARYKNEAAVSMAPVGDPSTGCFEPNADPRTVYKAPPPVPVVANGEVQLRVDLGADNVLRNVSIYRSSGYPLLDQAAEDAARASRFATRVVNCRPIAASYRYNVIFVVQRR